jgi:hypothetical protein
MLAKSLKEHSGPGYSEIADFLLQSANKRPSRMRNIGRVFSCSGNQFQIAMLKVI